MNAHDLFGALLFVPLFGGAFIGCVLSLWATESEWSH